MVLKPSLEFLGIWLMICECVKVAVLCCFKVTQIALTHIIYCMSQRAVFLFCFLLSFCVLF